MNNQKNSSSGKGTRVAQKKQVRHLFNSLKTVALGIIIVGICLMFVLTLFNIDPILEFTILFLFGITSSGFIIARGRSIILSYEAHGKDKVKIKEKL